jgi:hypothetical protein
MKISDRRQSLKSFSKRSDMVPTPTSTGYSEDLSAREGRRPAQRAGV